MCYIYNVWRIKFFDRKVMDTVLKWPKTIQAKFTHIVELIEKHGPQEVGMPFVKAIGNKLFEIRSKGQEGIGRAFFCMAFGKEIIILHAFIKKTQKIPAKELEIAKKRLKEVQK